MTDTLSALLAQNTRTVYLLDDGETVQAVNAETPNALKFVLARVEASRVRTNLLYAVLGQDGYVKYATWYNAQAQAQLQQAQAKARKPDEPEPFDDTLPEDANWRAHTIALEEAAEEAVVQAGLVDPAPTAQVLKALGRYRTALVRELVQWDRGAPEDPNSSSGNSEPP